jgi:hypothetical protein
MSDTSDTTRRKKTARRKRAKSGLPYENATSGKNAVKEMEKVLRAFGASSFGHMEDFDQGELIVQFSYRGRKTVRASGKGYAAQWLRKHPHSRLMRIGKQDYEKRALEIGRIAVYSILRDWIKGQITAVETGILSFEGAFLGQIMLPSGETVMEHIEGQRLLTIAPPTH